MTLRILLVLALATCLFAIGCQEREEIRSYAVAKEVPVRPAATSFDTQPTDRMLAAVLPEDGQAWFFKATGPLAEMDRLADPIERFFASVRPAAGKPLPDWQLPAGWELRPASGMRAATIVIPSAAKPMEISVTRLPWSGAPGELLNNVNRWRGQMQLESTDENGLAESTREVQVGDAILTIVDLRGRAQAGGMTPPFAGGASLPPLGERPVPSATAGKTGTNALPSGHPPIDVQSSARAPQPPPTGVPFQFDAPSDWRSLAASGIRKAAFQVTDGAKEALVTVIDFRADAGPMMADPLANVNRWRGELGLPLLKESELDAALEPIEVDGQAAQFVTVLPNTSNTNESLADRGTLAAMLTRDGVIWFFKLTGDRDLVAGQRDEFLKFLQSVRFTPTAPRADDGN